MAFTPCDCHGKQFRGKSTALYPKIIRDGTKFGQYVRLCHEGMQDFLYYAHRFFHDRALDDYRQNLNEPACDVCGAATVDMPVAVIYATTFPAKDVRRDYSGVVCFGCLPDVASALHTTV